MARRKTNWWYVLVLTDEGPTFVTGFESRTWCRFNKLAAPLEMTQQRAKEVAYGLCLNCISAFAVCSCTELVGQPFLYERGQFEWKWTKKEAKDEIQEG